ncbi:P-loop containing nucleoside triphosphate hydrolase protein [Flagelloscypha sp. PMI_526]|nr:P-loop containing nucleoside triphosphate hydrolase protein [Flagelloscypha sp. PMI_526]
MICNSCCSSCLSGQTLTMPSSSSSSSDPWSLQHFLKAGVILLNVSSSFINTCDHIHTEDGWHIFNPQVALGYLQHAKDDSLCRALNYLNANHYLRTTFDRPRQGTTLIIRIYLIPYDLSNVRGVLRIRKETGTAKHHLRHVLPYIMRGCLLWGGELDGLEYARHFLPEEQDTRSLTEIYGDLPSPEVDLSSSHANILSDKYHEDYLGLRSTLHPYQRRSVTAMIEREYPCYVPVWGPIVQPPNGGLLCEELGTGKTVMILSLVLASLKEMSTPEPSIVDPRPVLTPLALAAFPSGIYEQARGRIQKSTPSIKPRVPSLVELLIHLARLHPNDVKLDSDSRLEETKFPELIEASTPFYYQFSSDPVDFERTSRRTLQSSAPKRLYLTSATIIVVPGMLVEQWYREIHKHVEIQLRILRLGKHEPLPPPQKLATNYDVEAQASDVSKLHTTKPCRCAFLLGTRIPDCTCHISSVTPLLQVRWKRLVIDEGHISGTLNSVSTSFARQLSAQHRWIVTGTPTTNLLGLSFGVTPETSSSEVTTEADVDLAYPSTEVSCRVWESTDAADLNKLGNMIASFIAVPQFASNPTLMKKHVTEPLMDKCGPRPWSIDVLKKLMGSVMIRHRIEDIEKDVTLPPMQHESVLLDLDPYALKSFNMLQVIIIVNAIDSERKDQDYLFHPSNMDSLQLLVRNMSQMLFWRVDEDLYNIDELVTERRREELTRRALTHDVTEDDRVVLQEALYYATELSKDQAWREMQQHEDIPFRTRNLNINNLFRHWSRIQSSPGEDLIHPDRILKLRNLIRKRPLIAWNDLLSLGEQTSKLDSLRRQLYEQSISRKEKGRKSSSSTRKNRNDVKEQAGSLKARSADTLREMQSDLQNALKRWEEQDDGDAGPGTFGAAVVNQSVGYDSSQIGYNPLAKARIGRSASSKLNWILNEVLQYSQAEKFLIFSDSELTLSHTAEALELLNIKVLRFTSSIAPNVREQLVLTFETSETYRVFLMSLKHGARGLNLVSASRVIFCEPVWQADVESQAIKRVHRIGQTRPVIVKTLAIRGTQEDAMVARRNSLLDKQGKVPKLLEEAGMRHFIAHPTFLKPSPSSTDIDVPLFNLSPLASPVDAIDLGQLRITQTKPGFIKIPSLSQITAAKQARLQQSQKEVEVDLGAGSSNTIAHESPPKKRRVIRFADEE